MSLNIVACITGEKSNSFIHTSREIEFSYGNARYFFDEVLGIPLLKDETVLDPVLIHKVLIKCSLVIVSEKYGRTSYEVRKASELIYFCEEALDLGATHLCGA